MENISEYLFLFIEYFTFVIILILSLTSHHPSLSHHLSVCELFQICFWFFWFLIRSNDNDFTCQFFSFETQISIIQFRIFTLILNIYFWVINFWLQYTQSTCLQISILPFEHPAQPANKSVNLFRFNHIFWKFFLHFKSNWKKILFLAFFVFSIIFMKYFLLLG